VQILRNLSDHMINGRSQLAVRRRIGHCSALEQPDRPKRRGPCAEILRRVIGAQVDPEVLVYLWWAHRMACARRILELEQVSPIERATSANDARDSRIGHLDPMRGPTLAVEVEHRAPGAREAHVTVFERCQTVGPVVAGVFGIADPHTRRVKQPHDRRNHFVARQTWACKIASDPPA
jgi:hypothetical protein